MDKDISESDRASSRDEIEAVPWQRDKGCLTLLCVALINVLAMATYLVVILILDGKNNDKEATVAKSTSVG